MALTNKLSAIGDAIREKTGGTELMTLDEMPTAIASITTGGGGDFELPVVTGDCKYRFSYNGWNGVLDYVTTQDITGCNSMFYNSDGIETIPFEINCDPDTAMDLTSIFGFCRGLKSIPKINNCKPKTLSGMISGCNNIRYLPEDIESWFDWSLIDNKQTYAYNIGASFFNSCVSLRSAPMGLLSHEYQRQTNLYSNAYYTLFQSCYALDEIIGLPVHYRDNGITSNFFSNTFYNCNRIKNMTFALQEDGTPYKAKWKSQVIDLSNSVGWGYESNITGNNSGITKDNLVNDSNTWASKVDTPDWYTTDYKFSRYNLDSAIATINSLPDTSEYLAEVGGTNTITFKGEAGSGEAEGNKAINKLTEQQIAVATAKGWTVSLV